MKVLILFCGGTIIMKKNKDGALAVPPKEEAIQSLMTLEPRLGDIANIEVLYIDNIDSANITSKHWDKIGKAIYQNYNKYDGFVITHGTDTMAYSASALTWILQDLGKPVVITGAQIPGNEIETDARRNFVNAVRLATMDISGVMIVFDEEIILGARASKVSESKLDAFETINWDDLGEIRIDIRLSEEHKKRHKRNVVLKQGFQDNIAVVSLFPQMVPTTLHAILKTGIKGLVLRGYGSGNISYEYLSVLKECKKRKIPVVVHTQCLEGATLMHLYDVGKQALDAGVIQAHDMSLECVTTKLMWALKHAPYKSIKEIMHTNFVGEINVEGKIY